MIVVADTSILLNLCAIGHEDLARRLFDHVCAPPEVREEFDSVVRRMDRFAGLVFPPWIDIRVHHSAVPELRSQPDLDPGETAALELALEIKADAVLIDEASGRQAALRLGLRTFGILGILIRAKEALHIPAVAPVLEQLKTVRFFLTDAERDRCLRFAGENPGA